MNWKRVINTFADEFSRWFDSKVSETKESNGSNDMMGRDYVIHGLIMLSKIKNQTIDRFGKYNVKRIEIDDDGLLIWFDDSISDLKEHVQSGTFYRITDSSIFVNSNRMNEFDPSMQFFFYCITDVQTQIDTMEEWADIPKVQNIFIRYDDVLVNIYNTMQDSLDMLGIIGTDEVIEKYRSFLDGLFQEAHAAYSEYTSEKDKIERMDREAISKSLLNRLKFDEEYLAANKRFNK